eukprot:12169840-Alexandrium_andersonii.AAC.1
MSASLVGSEMCIRDSPRAAQFKFGPPPRSASGALLDPLRLQILRLREPVSYTHLTLPTICSV